MLSAPGAQCMTCHLHQQVSKHLGLYMGEREGEFNGYSMLCTALLIRCCSSFEEGRCSPVCLRASFGGSTALLCAALSQWGNVSCCPCTLSLWHPAQCTHCTLAAPFIAMCASIAILDHDKHNLCWTIAQTSRVMKTVAILSWTAFWCCVPPCSRLVNRKPVSACFLRSASRRISCSLSGATREKRSLSCSYVRACLPPAPSQGT